MVLQVKVQRKLFADCRSPFPFKESPGFFDDSVYMLCFIRFVHIDFDIGLYSPFYLLHVGVEMWAGGEAYCPSVRQFGSERHAGATTGFVTHDSDIGQTAHLIDEIVGCAVGAAVGQHYCFLLPTYAVAGFQFYGVGFGEIIMSLAGFVAYIPSQHFLVGETGGDAFGVGYVAAAIVAYVNDKSAAWGKIGEYLIQVSVA